MKKNNHCDQTCRFCKTPLHHVFADLGMSPLSNRFILKAELNRMEPFFPLIAYTCESCKLVQLDQYEAPQDIFANYAYFSSYSKSWLDHAKRYTESMVNRFKLNSSHKVVEIASNDGYLLQYFHLQKIPTLGIEPAENVAQVAQEKGLETVVDFFCSNLATKLSERNYSGDLILGNNVLAHVPDLNDFVKGLKILLKSTGIITMEFPHLLRLIELNQFDTIYHEHFSYFSLSTAKRIFEHHDLKLFDVDQISTHGGSLRIYACHIDNTDLPTSPSVSQLLEIEKRAGMDMIDTYSNFSKKTAQYKRDLLAFLIKLKTEGKTIAAYGAPAKGNTLLNYCGICKDFIDYTVDLNPHKQDKYLPGSHIPIFSPEHISKTKPDYILILPWNLQDEIIEQLDHVRNWGCKFILPIPNVRVIE